MPAEEVHMLVQTGTNNLIITTLEEAKDAILLHCPTAESFLQRRRVKKEILYQYLHNNRVPMSATDKVTGQKDPSDVGLHFP